MPDVTKLNSAIDSYAERALGSDADGGELSRQRALALEAYQGLNIEPAPEGRSQVIDWTVFETVQWILPSLGRIFAGGADIVEFEPTGPEDEDIAKQESEVLNYLVTQKNNWFLTFMTWAQDALITKNAYCMAMMEEKISVEIERYEGQSEDQIALLLDDPDVEVVAQEQFIEEGEQGPLLHPITLQPVTDPQQQQEAQILYQQFGAEPEFAPVVKFNIDIKHTKAKKRLKFEVLPPERCLVDADTPDFTLEGCNYFEYFDDVSISDLRKEGYDVDDDIAAEDIIESEEDEARDANLQQSIEDHQTHPDPSMRMVKARKIWIRHDYDDDGIAELSYVLRVGQEVLTVEPASRIPVASLVPFINCHRHAGVSVADLTFDIQRIKTVLLRSGLDSMYQANQPRHAAGNKVDLDDLLLSRVGGVVRVDTDMPDVAGHVVPLQTENTFPFAQQGLLHMDSVTESRVGVSRQFQGIDTSANNDFNRIGQLSTMAAQRVEQIARIMANGVERLFSIAHELIIKSGHSMDSIRLRGQWLDIDPSQWRTGRDMRIVAPFAAGNKDSLLQRFQYIATIHEKALAAGLPIVDPSDAYELALDIAQAADVNGEKYFTDPTTVEPPPPPPDHTMIALEIEKMKVEAEMQDESRKADIEKDKAALQAEIDKYRADLDAQVKHFQTEANRELQMALAQIKAGQAADTEMLRAALKPDGKPNGKGPVPDNRALQEALDAVREAVKAANGAKRVLRDDQGRVMGVEPV